jgi:putative chitinase
MIEITKNQLQACIPAASKDIIDTFCAPLNTAMQEFKINTPLRIAAFIAQIAHESRNLYCMTESTFYKDAEYLYRMFPRDFDSVQDASNYVKNSRKCASRIYANQNGNGSEASEDGWKYKGRGLIQLSGRTNYAAAGKALGLDLLEYPLLAETPEIACRTAGWFWNTHGCNELADVGLFGAITKRINGGYNGAAQRLKNYAVCKKALGIA